MPSPAQPSSQCKASFAVTIAALARPADIRALPLHALHLVMAMRLCALFDAAGREPIGELTQRFRSVGTALAVLSLNREIARIWPERFMVSRPCCTAMTPDERTLAALVRAAATGNREAFKQTLDGFVRADRHERLFADLVRAVAAVQPGAA